MKKTLIVCLLVLACVASVFAKKADNNFVKVTFSPYVLDLHNGQTAADYGFDARVAYGYITEKGLIVGFELGGKKLINVDNSNADANIVMGEAFLEMPFSRATNTGTGFPVARVGLGTTLSLVRENGTKVLLSKNPATLVNLALFGVSPLMSPASISENEKCLVYGANVDFAVWKGANGVDFATQVAPFVGASTTFGTEPAF